MKLPLFLAVKKNAIVARTFVIKLLSKRCSWAQFNIRWKYSYDDWIDDLLTDNSQILTVNLMDRFQSD